MDISYLLPYCQCHVLNNKYLYIIPPLLYFGFTKIMYLKLANDFLSNSYQQMRTDIRKMKKNRDCIYIHICIQHPNTGRQTNKSNRKTELTDIWSV